ARLRALGQAAAGAPRAWHGHHLDVEGHHDRPRRPQAGHRRRGHLRGLVMSRIGKKPVPIPGGVQVTLRDSNLAVKGPKGELKRMLPDGVKVQVDKAQIEVTREGDEGAIRARHGLVRALINNMIEGVTKGFERKLEINGVGYKAEVAGTKLNLSLGYSHPIAYDLPKGIGAKVEKN